MDVCVCVWLDMQPVRGLGHSLNHHSPVLVAVVSFAVVTTVVLTAHEHLELVRKSVGA